MLTIDGKYDASHILGDLIAKECAFSCFWDDAELRVTHHKGTWVLAKIRKEKLIDRLEATDTMEYQTDNPLLLGLVQAFDKGATRKENDYDDGGRELMGRILSKTVSIWVHPTEKMKKINVIQAGRNSWLDAEGTFSFSPDSK